MEKRIYMCPYCREKRVFKRPATLRSHVRVLHEGEAKDF